MAKSKTVTVKASMLGAAAIFLFNPNVMLFDVLPDFIGWLLLLYAFLPISRSVPHFDDACSFFKKMLWISLARYPAFIIMLSVYFNNQTERAIVPLFVLIFCTLELIFGILAIRALFEGIGYAASRAECDSAFYLTVSKRKENRLRKRLEKAELDLERKKAKKHYQKKIARINSALHRRLSLSALSNTACIMLAVKAAAEFLPELTFLSSFDSLGYIAPVSVNILSYRKYFVILACTVALISGIVFLKRFIGYSRNLSSCSELNEYFAQKIAESNLNSSKAHVAFKIRYSCLLYAVGFTLMIDFYSDSFNVIPDFIGYAVMLLAAINLLSLTKAKIGICISGAMCLISSVLSWVNVSDFTTKYDYAAVALRDDAANAFVNSFIINAVEQIFALVFIAFIFAQLKNIAKNYASYNGDSINSYTAEKIPLHIVFARKFNISFVGAVITSIASLFLLLSRTDTVKTVNRLNNTMYIPRLGWFWILQFCITAVWVAYTVSTVMSLKNECGVADSK